MDLFTPGKKYGVSLKILSVDVMNDINKEKFKN